MLNKASNLNIKIGGARRSTTSLPYSTDHSIATPFHNNEELSLTIKEYQQQWEDNEQTEDQKQGKGDTGVNNIQDIYIQSGVKNNTKPVRMFKDEMQLKKENAEKKITVKQLQTLNKQLKQQYDIALNNNKKMEQFLKQIEFTFKNDRSNQKANQILMKATKTLNRQKQQSKNYIQKLVKTVKINQMRQLKSYARVLQVQKQKLLDLLSIEEVQNQNLRQVQDFNDEQVECFQYCQNLLKQILQQGLQDIFKIRQCYKIQKSQIKIRLCYKEVQHIKKEITNIDQRIVQQLLKKQGLEYQTQIIANKMKSKNKRNVKEQGSILKEQIKNKKLRINMLIQQYKQKKKTQQYISKWTKQLKNQLEQLKQNHKIVKDQFEQEINKLSKQIEEWNRKYKTQLIQEQTTNKKGAIKQATVGKDRSCPERKIRIVKIYEIDYLRKKLMFYLIENNLETMEYVKQNIFGNSKIIKLQQMHRRLCELQPFEEEDNDEIFKFARYVVEDNNNDYTKINTQQTIQVNIATLIFKNLLTSDISSKNLPIIRAQIKQFLNKNYDAVRHQIWLNSGKSSTFNLINLRNALAKYIKQQITISKFVQLIEYLIWKKFGQSNSFRLNSFQKVSQTILGKKLIKDEKNRISSTTIRSVFDKIYSNLLNENKNGATINKIDEINQMNESINE